MSSLFRGVFCLALFINQCHSAYYDEDFFKWTSNTSEFTQYNGYYVKNATDTTTEICGTEVALYDGTYYYELINSDPPIYIYEPDDVDGTSYHLVMSYTKCANLSEDDFILESEYLIVFGGNGWPLCGVDGTWSTPNGSQAMGVEICDTNNGACTLPTSKPTDMPTGFPTFDPTYDPTLEPTTVPTAPYLKYIATADWTTSGNDFDMAIKMFVWTDAPTSNITFSMTGPNNLSWIQVFRNEYSASPVIASDFFDAINGSSGYIVNPTEDDSGEIYMDQPAFYDYSNYSEYTQNSSMENSEYLDDGLYWIQMTRPIETSDNEDFRFNFTNFLNSFYVCYAVASPFENHLGQIANEFDTSEDFGCESVDFEGNYGLRAKWSTSDSDPVDITIYFEYNPFNFTYQGYVKKPEDVWVLWGRWYDEVNSTVAMSTKWSFATFCDISNDSTTSIAEYCQFANYRPKNYDPNSGLGVQNTETFLVSKNTTNGVSRMDFKVNGVDLDSAFYQTSGWDTVRFLSTRKTVMHVSYGRTRGEENIIDTIDVGNETYLGQHTLFMEYVTAAPTSAPTDSPTDAPSNAPSLAPTLNPSLAPSLAPSLNPSLAPSNAPSLAPSLAPSDVPSQPPSTAPSLAPSNAPSHNPSLAPSTAPSYAPTVSAAPLFCVSFCYSDSLDDVASLNDAFGSALASVSGITGLNGNCSEITVISLNDSSSTESSDYCVECCSKIWGFGERMRWKLLYSVNSDIDNFARLFSYQIAGIEASAITYAYADHPLSVSDYCTDLPYPRICRLHVMDSYYFSLGMDSTTSLMHFSMTYGDGNTWFGVGFGDVGMNGDALVYTTGLTGSLSESVYDYYLSDQSGSGIGRDSRNDVGTVTSSTVNGSFTVEFTRDMVTGDASSDYAFNLSDCCVDLFFAFGVGSGLELSYHLNNTALYGNSLFVPSPYDSDVYWCDSDDLCLIGDIDYSVQDSCGDLSGTVSINDFVIYFEICKETNTIAINVSYSDFNDNWFGLTFGDSMVKHNALVYTTGKSEDRVAGLYSYYLKAKSLNSVVYEAQNDWELLLESIDLSANRISMKYKQFLNRTQWDTETTTIGFRYAIGSGLRLKKHESTGDYVELNLENGKVTRTNDDDTMIVVHGSIMFVAWQVCASFGIIASAHRWMFPMKNGGVWSAVHRSLTMATAVLTIIGFIVIVVHVSDEGDEHFADPHMIVGLCVVCLVVVQTLNGLLIPHYDALEMLEKSKARKVWEICHKLIGYIAWLASMFLCLSGPYLLNNQEIGIWNYLIFAWIVCVCVVYIALWMYQCFCLSNNGGNVQTVQSIEMHMDSADEVTKQTSQPFVEDSDDDGMTKPSPKSIN